MQKAIAIKVRIAKKVIVVSVRIYYRKRKIGDLLTTA